MKDARIWMQERCTNLPIRMNVADHDPDLKDEFNSEEACLLLCGQVKVSNM